MQDDVSEGVMIALLPITTDWCKIECPHLTLVYCGKTSELKPGVFNQLVQDASALAAISKPLTLKVTGVDLFGVEDDTKVLTLRLSPEIAGMRRFVEKWNRSEHKTFRPHVTVGPRDSIVEAMPPYIAFDRIMVGWGDEQVVFGLRR